MSDVANVGEEIFGGKRKGGSWSAMRRTESGFLLRTELLLLVFAAVMNQGEETRSNPLRNFWTG